MYLKQIRISGFKSFADKVNIELKPGITGIVGPNGSGKSNIVDAVRWVLGEQSVKSLRGDATMTDVIFSGSKKRSPMSSASVTLVFDNTDHSLKVDYTEVSIKRTIYKTGENEYYLNNEKVRLKDILDLLLDSGSAKESFSIISQGDIAEVLSAKPEDRRVIFESAAGVLKYKKRKIEAEKKLDKTHDNIDRINDIINELEMQIEPLKKQSEDATLYLDTKKELESIEVSLIVDDIDKINKEYVESKSKIETLNKDIISLSTISSTNDANLSKMKSSLSTLNDTLYKKQEELVKITSLTEKLNGEKNIIGERKKYEVDDVKLHNNIISLKEEELKLNNNKDVLNNEINNLKLELDSCNKEITTVTGSFNNLINKKNDKNIVICILKNFCGCIHPDEDIFTQQADGKRHHHSKRARKPDNIAYITAETIVIAFTKFLGNRNCTTLTDPHAKAKNQEIDRTGGTDTRQRVDAKKFSDNHSIGHTVQLLEKDTQKQRNHKADNQLHRRAGGQVACSRLFLFYQFGHSTPQIQRITVC